MLRRYVHSWIIAGFLATSVHASERDRRTNCAQQTLLRGIAHSLGVEWEFADLPYLITERRLRVFFSGGMDNSELAKLYVPHGKNGSGQWVSGLIPRRIARKKSFQEIRNQFRGHFEERNGEVFLKLSELSKSGYARILQQLLSIRGRNETDLKIRKNRTVWSRSSTEVRDSFLPEELAEEWRGEKLVNFEIPLNGGVANAEGISSFFRNLFYLLGWTSKLGLDFEELFQETRGHIHSVARPVNLPKDRANHFYRNWVGRWGFLNDAAEVRFLALIALDKASKGRFPNERFFQGFEKALFARLSTIGVINVLTRSVFDRVQVCSDGVSVAGQDSEENDFPVECERLRVGLRAFYEGGPIGFAPVRTVGHEVRELAGGTLIPETLKFAIHPSEVLDQDPDYAQYGLLSRPDEILAAAESSGLERGVVERFVRWSAKKSSDEDSEQMLSLIFLPLNSLFDHPSAQLGLARVSSSERKRLRQVYDKALANYVRSMNKMEADFIEGRRHYFRYESFSNSGPEYTFATPDDDALFFRGYTFHLGEFLAESGIGEIFEAEPTSGSWGE